MPQPKPNDHDFEIHVDPSCLSAPIDDETTPATNMSEIEDTHNEQHEAMKEDGHRKQTQEEHAGQDKREPTPDRDEDASMPSSSSRRVISTRTDALIQEAARSVVDQIERQRETDYNSCRESGDGDSIMSSAIGLGTEMSYGTGAATNPDLGRHGSGHTGSRPRSTVSSAASAAAHEEDRGGDSSSHHEVDSEVFSERSNPSLRSSLGSFDGRTSPKDARDDHRHASPMNGEDRHHHNHYNHDTLTQRTGSPRFSDISMYEDHDEPFIPTIRGRPRVPFRTPSDVRAIQLSSPAPSIFSGSPRSAKRAHLPTTSRLGSPSASAQVQYSPKSRTTPSRLKPRKVTPPLVLLHATLLPLRWPWASVLEAAPSDALSPAAKTLRDNWRRLHDRLGDTVCERGILLPHPQADYEVLQERLLDALDLPLRRRARILECGHYLGPANEHTLTEELDSDGDGDDGHGYGHGYDGGRSPRSSTSSFRHGSRHSAVPQTHWCVTCHHDIRFESLGPGKVFHVKVYASNGLMRAGAWSACWKEMERVDVEIDPIVNPDLLDELERLALAQQQEAEDGGQAPTTTGLNPSVVEADADTDTDNNIAGASTPSLVETPAQRMPHRHRREPSYDEYLPTEDPSASPTYSTASRRDHIEERRRREQARLREIYGQTPPPTASRAASQAAPASPAPEPRQFEPEAPPQQEMPPFSSSSHMPSPPPEEEAQPHSDTRPRDDIPHAPSPDPTAARNHAQHAAPSPHLQTASFPELLLEAVRVLLQDRKNVALVLLSLLVLFLAVRPPAIEPRMMEWDGVFDEPHVPIVGRDEGAGPDVDFGRDVPLEKTMSKEHPYHPAAQSSNTFSVDDSDPHDTQPYHDQPDLPAGEVEMLQQAHQQQQEQQHDPSQQVPQESQVPQQQQQQQQQQEPSAQKEPDHPSVDQEPITTREVVRIIETVTHTETIKAFVTETPEKQVDIPPADSDSSFPSSSSYSSPSASSASLVSPKPNPFLCQAFEEVLSSSGTHSIPSHPSEENVPDEHPVDGQKEHEQFVEAAVEAEQGL
ncbi:hypothetical protein ACRALDRAFT_2058811 [Sodiomyces alcalophilus JCM 7366]|uniref:uncharacterized protein n=1 Tax=Sodiomyces alcalophilus JCM 7366 TaxID=591952 RepID=UPI0039B4192C